MQQIGTWQRRRSRVTQAFVSRDTPDAMRCLCVVPFSPPGFNGNALIETYRNRSNSEESKLVDVCGFSSGGGAVVLVPICNTNVPQVTVRCQHSSQRYLQLPKLPARIAGRQASCSDLKVKAPVTHWERPGFGLSHRTPFKSPMLR